MEMLTVGLPCGLSVKHTIHKGATGEKTESSNFHEGREFKSLYKTVSFIQRSQVVKM